jgi:hypothetical protein
VETIRKIEARRVLDGGREPSRAARGTFTRPRDSLGIARLPIIDAFASNGESALPDFLNIEIIEPLANMFLETSAFIGNRHTEPVDSGTRNVRTLFELTEYQERDVEFASRTEHSGQASDATRHLLRFASRPNQRQSRAETAGRNPRLMQRLYIAVFGGRQRAPQRGDTLPDEVFRGWSTHNYQCAFPKAVASL